MKSVPKRLVLYREKLYSNQDSIKSSIVDNLNALSPEEANAIVNYMKNGLVLIEFVSPTADPYNTQDRVPNTYYSDGKYYWDDIIINWIRKNRIRLPEEFRQHVREAKMYPNKRKDLDREYLLDNLKHSAQLTMDDA